MRVKKVIANNRKRAFEIETPKGTFLYPYGQAQPAPTPVNRVAEAYVDPELGREGFSYVLDLGQEGTVHLDHVLEYNQDPDYLTDDLLYRLSVEAQERMKRSAVGIRDLARRLETSPAQVYRLLDQTNYRKSVRKMVSLLHFLDCEVDMVIRSRKRA